MRWSLAVLACMFVGVGSIGCRDSAPDKGTQPSEQAPPQRAAVELTVLVVQDQSLADAVKLLRGAWTDRSGGTVRVDVASAEELFARAAPEADLMVYPARYLGELAERQWLRPLRDSVWNGKEFRAGDIFPLVRSRQLSYGGARYAAPLACYASHVGYPLSWRNAANEPPQTWAELAKLAEQRETDEKLLAAPRLPPYWRSHLLIATAAGYADPNSGEGLLFDEDSMEPRLQTPPMVRALQRIAPVLAHVEGAGQVGTTDAADVVWGEWPAAESTFAGITGTWQNRPSKDGGITLLGADGRLVSVTSQTRNTATAFKLLGWMASGSAAAQLNRRSAGGCPCRESQVGGPGEWLVEPQSPAQAAFGARIVAAALSREASIQIPRILSVDKYLESLEAAIKRAAEEGVDPATALREASGAWEEATAQIGRERQRAAYQAHLKPGLTQ